VGCSDSAAAALRGEGGQHLVSLHMVAVYNINSWGKAATGSDRLQQVVSGAVGGVASSACVAAVSGNGSSGEQGAGARGPVAKA